MMSIARFVTGNTISAELSLRHAIGQPDELNREVNGFGAQGGDMVRFAVIAAAVP
jgi:hypothetical protein